MLTAAEFADIHASVLEAMGYVSLDVSFYTLAPANADVDPLYGENKNGEDSPTLYATVKASVRERPTMEYLTRLGLRTDTAILVFIPRGEALAWEAAHPGQTFAITPDMELDFNGTRFSVNAEPRDDRLPVLKPDNTTGTDYIGLAVTASTKADSGE